MKVFISYSHKDKKAAAAIATRLRADGHEVWLDTDQLEAGDIITDKIGKALGDADVLVVIVSENSFRSDWVQREYSMLALNKISNRDRKIIPVRIDDSDIPSYLADRLNINLSVNFQTGLENLSRALRSGEPEDPTPAAEVNSATSVGVRADQIAKLRNILRQGHLTLVCGAGVSVEAGIPVWNELLIRLLDLIMEKLSDDSSHSLSDVELAEFQKRHGSSPLILGKFLKNNLRGEFAARVREVLYQNPRRKSLLVDSIVELARPQRDSRTLDSIITFNFDSIIEECLGERGISNKAIFSEATRNKGYELPIYHVHGYLPREDPIPEGQSLVFSEDAYHTQFIDPFSWSNLMLLNKLTQNTCLFIGISLTDPNMRRLLDVAWRKNSEKALGHYIVKKRSIGAHGSVLDEVSRLLEEQDANALGLNVIWIDDFGELPIILTEISRLE